MALLGELLRRALPLTLALSLAATLALRILTLLLAMFLRALTMRRLLLSLVMSLRRALLLKISRPALRLGVLLNRLLTLWGLGLGMLRRVRSGWPLIAARPAGVLAMAKAADPCG